MRADEEAPRPIKGHDHKAAATKDAPAVPAPAPPGKLVRQMWQNSKTSPPRLIYILDGVYAGELIYTVAKPEVLLAMAADFQDYARQLADNIAKPKIATASADLLRGH